MKEYYVYMYQIFMHKTLGKEATVVAERVKTDYVFFQT